MTKKKKIEREKKHIFRKYGSVIKGAIILILLVALLVGIIRFKPIKKEEVKDPSILDTNELLVNNNDATCDGQKAATIREEAKKVTIAYEIVDDYFFGYMAETDEDLNGNGILDDDPVIENRGYALKLKLNNLTDNIYVTIENDIDSDVKTFTTSSKGEDGLITWFEEDTTFIRTYDVKVYSANDGCRTQLYREFNVSLPRYNVLERSFDCYDEPGKSMDVCQPFTFKNQTASDDVKDFKQAMREMVAKRAAEDKKKEQEAQQQEAEKEKGFKEKSIDFVKQYYIYIIPAAVVLLVAIILIVKRVKK